MTPSPDGGDIFLSLYCREKSGEEALPNQQEIVLEVRDTGPGVSEDLRERVFDLLFTTKGERGSGIGLAMVPAHRTRIWRSGGMPSPENPAGARSFKSVFQASNRSNPLLSPKKTKMSTKFRRVTRLPQMANGILEKSSSSRITKNCATFKKVLSRSTAGAPLMRNRSKRPQPL